MISRKNWRAILLAGNGSIQGVASRDKSRAESFIQQSLLRMPVSPEPKAYGSYEELLADPNVDAVYLPLPTGVRKQWVIRAAEQGKHVLCEKPCATSTDDLRDMIDACARNNVQFMDGVMYMHSKRLESMRKALDDGDSVGEIRRIATQFSFCAPPEFYKSDIRTSTELEPYGCLGDLGWYTIRFSLWAMHYDLPRRVIGRILRSTDDTSGNGNVPLEFSGDLFFDGGVTASFYNSFVTHHQQWGHVSGTKGALAVNDYVLPFYGNASQFYMNQADFNATGWDFNMQRFQRTVEIHEYSNGTENSPETNLFRTFGDLVLRGETESFWPEVALKTQTVLDACFQSAQDGGKTIELSDRFAGITV